MTPEMTAIILKYGFVGVVVIVEALVIIYLWNELKSERKSKDELQDKRLQDALTVSDKVTGPLDEQKKLSQKIYDIVELLVNRRDNRGE